MKTIYKATASYGDTVLEQITVDTHGDHYRVQILDKTDYETILLMNVENYTRILDLWKICWKCESITIFEEEKC